MGIIPGGSGILTISIRIPWKKVGISMELETKMAEAPANCFPLKFHGIPQNSDFPLGIWQIPQELMEEGKDLTFSLEELKKFSTCCKVESCLIKLSSALEWIDMHSMVKTAICDLLFPKQAVVDNDRYKMTWCIPCI